MIDRVLLTQAVAGLIVAFLTLIVILLTQSWISAHRARRRVPRLAAARATLIDLARGEPVDATRRSALNGLAPRQRLQLLTEIAHSLDGVSLDALLPTAQSMGVIKQAQRRLSSRLWWRRLSGIRLLNALGASSPEFVALLSDAHPLVRAQAAEWAARNPDPDVLHALAAMLGERNGLPRFWAKDALIRIGAPAVPLLQAALEGGDERQTEAALEVTASLGDQRLAAGVHALTGSDVARLRALAAAALGTTGDERAVSYLSALFRDPVPEVRAQAAGAAGQLGHWRAAAMLAPLLEDRSWDVRQRTGLALLQLDAPGRLVLRVATRSHDAFAADMAHQILDVADLDDAAIGGAR